LAIGPVVWSLKALLLKKGENIAIIDDKLELVNFPQTQGSFKVVQLEVRGRPVAVFGQKNAVHAKILEAYLTQQGLTFPQIPIPKYPSLHMPAVEGPDYKVVGMGEIDVDPTTKFFQLPYGSSFGYELGVDKRFNRKLKEHLKGWNF